jgi:hypothetical protein
MVWGRRDRQDPWEVAGLQCVCECAVCAHTYGDCANTNMHVCAGCARVYMCGWVDVIMCVCGLYACTCMYISVHVCLLFVSTHMCICLCVYLQWCMPVSCVYTHVCCPYVCVHEFVYTCTCMYICACVYVCTQTCTQTSVYYACMSV